MTTRSSLSLTVTLALAGAVVLVGCAGSSYVKDAAQAERAGRYDQAVALYTQALAEKPGEPHIQQDLDRAKLRASSAHALEAVRRLQLADLSGAKDEFEIALTLNPTDNQLAAQLRRLEETIAQRGEEADRQRSGRARQIRRFRACSALCA